MATIIIELDPRELANPDLDLRYALPDLLSARSGGLLAGDGYDYSSDPDCPRLLLFMSTSDTERSLACIREAIAVERPLGNDLAHAAKISVRSE